MKPTNTMDNNETKKAWNKPYEERERGKLFDEIQRLPIQFGSGLANL